MSSMPVPFTCPDGHSSSLDFKRGLARYQGSGECVGFEVVEENTVIDGEQSSSSGVYEGCGGEDGVEDGGIAETDDNDESG